jgi:hypothetical protein
VMVGETAADPRSQHPTFACEREKARWGRTVISSHVLDVRGEA